MPPLHITSWYLASAYAYTQIPHRGTSDTLGTLSEMPKPAIEIEKYKSVYKIVHNGVRT